ncbi:zinc finger protein OZF-like [Leguminivora glycinivorella]|uniref:zinc finger protein OZF-like n=1 Tax=Leguminivora glycinivorella TaxID=1035111 RepID=UPI00200DDB6E|nr:zinc finger protein OZF-like [Leguminivora glycinivorella]
MPLETPYDMEVEVACVKTEPGEACAEEREREDSARGVSAAAARAGLYTGHEVKDKLVLGPEEWHQEKVPVKAPSTVEREVLGRACSVLLERLPPHAFPTQRYQCHDCGGRFQNKTDLTIHIREHSTSKSIRKFVCRYCNSMFKTKLLLLEHKKSECKFLTDKTSLKTQKRTVKLLNCKLCSFTTRYKHIFTKHRTIHAGEKPYKCSQCDYRCKRKSYLHVHEESHSDEKPYSCSECDFKCRLEKYLRKHQMTHTGVKPFKCSRCEHRTYQKANLRRHEMTHTGDYSKPFKCSDCEYTCRDKQSLEKHQRTHTGERPYKCSHCDYASRDRSTLRKHNLIHTNQKPFQCICGYKCADRTSLRYHYMTHTGEKPYHCKYCDYKFSRRIRLLEHQMVHTGERPLKCSDCDYKCRKKPELLRHQLKTHR